MGVALMRAIEADKPPAERVCYDPYARAFISGATYFFLKPIINSGWYKRVSEGAVEFIIVRERTIDDFAQEALRTGLEQVVILGAGFDTRAYRLPGIAKTRVFEVDQPATQAAKLKGLKKVCDPLPAHVTFVPVDFNTQPLGERLLASGYNPRAKTLFIWQGVTYFLTATGVDATLAFIATQSGPGSLVIFDYVTNETLRDTEHGYGKALRRAGRMSGEAYLFGIDAGQAGAFLTQRGFREAHDLTLESLKQRYLTGPNAARPVPAGIAIVSAQINP